MVVDDILKTFALPQDDVRSCGGGGHGEDVQLSDKARECIPWSIECKNTEKLNFWNAFAQAVSNSRGHTPVVVAKKNHHEVLCLMRWTDALDLIRRANLAANDATRLMRAEEEDIPQTDPMQHVLDRLQVIEKRIDDIYLKEKATLE